MSKRTSPKVYRHVVDEARVAEKLSENSLSRSAAKLRGERMAKTVNNSTTPYVKASQLFGLLMRELYDGEISLAYVKEAREAFFNNLHLHSETHPYAMTTLERRNLMRNSMDTLKEYQEAQKVNNEASRFMPANSFA